MTESEQITGRSVMEGALPTNVYHLRQGEFSAIPGNPWVYWIPDPIRKLFIDLGPMSDYATPVIGCFTCDNFRFVHYWWEVGYSNIRNAVQKTDLSKRGKPYWIKYMKGGESRWYGNHQFVVKYNDNGKEIRERRLITGQSYTLPGEQYYLQPGVVFSHVSTDLNSKLLPTGFIFDVASSVIIPEEIGVLPLLGLMKSELFLYLLHLLNPTINIQASDIRRIPTKPKVDYLSKYVQKCIFLGKIRESTLETSLEFVAPNNPNNQKPNLRDISLLEENLEKQINQIVIDHYGFTNGPRDLLKEGINIDDEVEGDFQLDTKDPEELEGDITNNQTTEVILRNWLSYAIGIIMGRFSPGQINTLGCAVYQQSTFEKEPPYKMSAEDSQDLFGLSGAFINSDVLMNYHIFSPQVEKYLYALSFPDGIYVLDPAHPRDLTALVRKALILMLGEEDAQEVINHAASGDLRKYLEKDYFIQYHLKIYRKRPVYWYIQSAKRSYGFVIFHEKITRDTFYTLQREPYLETKRNAVALEISDLQVKLTSTQGSDRKKIEKQLSELHALADELAQFSKDLEEITLGGYEPNEDWIDDGVILRMAPLWKVIPLWKSEPKKYWKRLEGGDFDWSHIAMRYWPERVREACKKNKSFAIAHGHEEWYKG